jgi:hypothetical protein
MSCAQVANFGSLYEGYRVSAAGMPLTVVSGSKRVQVQSLALAQTLARTNFDLDDASYRRIRYAGSIHEGDSGAGSNGEVVSTPGKPAGFVLSTGVISKAGCVQSVLVNHSTIKHISGNAYDSLPAGPDLYRHRQTK